MEKAVKLKVCRVCRVRFPPARPMQTVCSPSCAIEWAKQKGARENARQGQIKRKTHREAIIKAKPLSWHRSKAQAAFNRYICLRDEMAGYGCISCGTQNQNIQYCAGHYRTRGAASQLAFNEDNVHRQCNKRCNLELSGNIREYRPALLAKIGQDRLEAIENNAEAKKWSAEELDEIAKIYRARVREMLKSRLTEP